MNFYGTGDSSSSAPLPSERLPESRERTCSLRALGWCLAASGETVPTGDAFPDQRLDLGEDYVGALGVDVDSGMQHREAVVGDRFEHHRVAGLTLEPTGPHVRLVFPVVLKVDAWEGPAFLLV